MEQKYAFTKGFLGGALLAGICAVLALASPEAKSGDEAAFRESLKPDYSRPAAIPYPKTNPYTREKAELGKLLFFDSRLSEKRNQNCASCHHPGLGWEIGMSKPIGAQEMPVKSPTLLNVAWTEAYFWDGRADSLEKQYLAAMASPKALNLSHAELEARVKAIPGYAPLFEKAFSGRGIGKETISEAVSTFERGIVSGSAPFDLWLRGKDGAISPRAKAGMRLFFGKANCAACHSGWNFTDNGFHDTGLDDDNLGRGKIAHSEVMQHAFKTPGLRDIAARAPYMHNGSLKTLRDVINFYDKGGQLAKRRPSMTSDIRPLGLTESEKRDLIEFLETLTGDNPPVTIPRLPL